MGNLCSGDREISTNQQKVALDYQFVIFGEQKKFDSINDVEKAIDSSASQEGSLPWNCQLMTKLTLSGNSYGYDACEHIGNLLKGSNAPNLRQIDFSNIFVGRLRAELPKSLNYMAESLRMHKLTEIDLSHNAFGPDGIRAFECLLREQKTLKVLKVTNCGLGPEGGEMIAEALSANKGLALQVFHAGRDRLENKGISALAKVFAQMKSLREIEVPQNGIKDEGMANLLEGLLACVENLQTIRVNDNYLKESAAEKLVDLVIHSSQLKELDISDLNMSQLNVVLVTRALHHRHNLRMAFWRFACNYNEIESRSLALECLETLQRIDSLQQIDIIGIIESKKLKKEWAPKFEGKQIRFVEEEEDEDEDEDEDEEEEEEEEAEADLSELDHLFEKFPMLKEKPQPIDFSRMATDLYKKV